MKRLKGKEGGVTSNSSAVIKLITPKQVSEGARCWEVPTEPKARLSVGRTFSASFSPDGENIIVLSSWGCWIYKNSSFPQAPVLLEESDSAFVFHSLSFSVKFSPDGAFFAFGEGQKVKVWDAKNRSYRDDDDLNTR